MGRNCFQERVIQSGCELSMYRSCFQERVIQSGCELSMYRSHILAVLCAQRSTLKHICTSSMSPTFSTKAHLHIQYKSHVSTKAHLHIQYESHV